MSQIDRLLNIRSAREETAHAAVAKELGQAGVRARGRERRRVLSPEEYFSGNAAWLGVESSNVHSLAFYGEKDGGSGILGVRFKDEKTGAITGEYRYDGVPIRVVEGFLSAPSKGKYHWRHIRDRYPTEQVGSRQ